MKFPSMRMYFILSLSILIILGMSTPKEYNTTAISDPISHLSNYRQASLSAASIPPSLLGNSNSTVNTEGQSLNNSPTVPNSFVVERNWTGSIPTFPTIIEAFKSQIRTSMNEATTTALEEVGRNSTALSSTLQPERGFLVYVVRVVDSDNQIHSIAVDAGDGKVLSNILLPNIDVVNTRSGPTAGRPAGPVGPIQGSGYPMPPLPPPLPNGGSGYSMPPLPPPLPNSGSGYSMPSLPVQPSPGLGGPVQPIQPPPPVQ